MAYFNFEIVSTGKQYSVDFKTYSDQYKIAGLGYKVLPVTDVALSGATVFEDAPSWLTGNAALFSATTPTSGTSSDTGTSGSGTTAG